MIPPSLHKYRLFGWNGRLPHTTSERNACGLRGGLRKALRAQGRRRGRQDAPGNALGSGDNDIEPGRMSGPEYLGSRGFLIAELET